jgi:hypothetical protein
MVKQNCRKLSAKPIPLSTARVKESCTDIPRLTQPQGDVPRCMETACGSRLIPGAILFCAVLRPLQG